MTLTAVNEQSTKAIVIGLTDNEGEALTPTSAVWTLTDTKGNVINSRSAIGIAAADLASSITIVLYGADLSIREGVYFGRERVLTVTGFYDSDLGDNLPFTNEARFFVTDLVAVQYVALTTPVLTAPDDGEEVTDYTPTFTWDAVTGAESYLFQLSTSSTFASIAQSQNGSATSFTATALTAGIPYYWRVRAQASGLSSDWSVTRDFELPELDTPIPSAPATATPLNKFYPTFRWNAISGASGYYLQVSTNSGFTALVDEYTGPTNSYHTATSYAASTTHYWRVRATGFGEIVSDWSATQTFTLYAVYVNASTGSDSNTGLSAAQSVLTLAAAQTALTGLGGNGIIRIVAPSTAPLGRGINTPYSFTAGKTVALEALVAGTPWYITNALQYTSGWTQVGSTDVWTRSNSSGSGSWWCPTIADAARDNLETEIARAAPDTTTPSAKQYSIVSTTTYINLGAGINPNSHQVERVRITGIMSVTSGATVYLRDAVLKYSTTGTVLENDGILYAEDCSVLYGGGSNISSTANATLTDLTDCVATRSVGNDGFNHNYGIMNLTNCTAKWNTDEGASPHASCTMNAYGGTYSHNDSPGFTAAENSIMNLYNVLCEYNNVSPSAFESTFGQIHYGAHSSGVCEDCTVRNGFTSGFTCNTDGAVTVSNLTSTGNASPDVFC